ncbi:MAG TPA: hypothetical protein VF175_02205, partial [Lacipirellula sp.]
MACSAAAETSTEGASKRSGEREQESASANSIKKLIRRNIKTLSERNSYRLHAKLLSADKMNDLEIANRTSIVPVRQPLV